MRGFGRWFCGNAAAASPGRPLPHGTGLPTRPLPRAASASKSASAPFTRLEWIQLGGCSRCPSEIPVSQAKRKGPERLGCLQQERCGMHCCETVLSGSFGLLNVAYMSPSSRQNPFCCLHSLGGAATFTWIRSKRTIKGICHACDMLCFCVSVCA